MTIWSIFNSTWILFARVFPFSFAPVHFWLYRVGVLGTLSVALLVLAGALSC